MNHLQPLITYIVISESGGISIGHANVDYPIPTRLLVPRGVLGGDNFNRVIKTQSWGKETRIDIFHLMIVIQSVRAPLSMSWKKPEIPIKNLTGIVGIIACKLLCTNTRKFIL